MTRILGRAGLLLIASATMTLACAHAPPVPAADPAEVRASIDGTLREFGAAMRRADPAAIASMFTEDGEYVVATRKGFVTGRAAVEEHFARLFKTVRFLDVVITTVSVQVEGDMAYETGTNSVTLQAGEAPPVTRTGRYLTVWKRQADGVWRIRVDAIVPDPAG